MATKSYLTLNAKFPIGIRRNNPGNLAKGSRAAYPGVTDRPDTGRGPMFLAFVDIPHGLLAMIHLVVAYVTQKGLNTLRKLAYHYAPPKEGNDTVLWIKQVASYAGITNPDAVLSTDLASLKRLVLAIAKKEVGLVWHVGGVTATITSQDFDDAMALIPS